MMLYRCVHCRPHYQWYGKVNRKTSWFFPGLFDSGAGAGDTASMHLPVYKMNFPRKNPMKMAAMTTRREGREAVVASRPRRLVEFDVMWSERGTFLILIISSCKTKEIIFRAFRSRVTKYFLSFILLYKTQTVGFSVVLFINTLELNHNISSYYEYYFSTQPTFSCRFSSASLLISACSLLHLSCTFFTSVSSSEALAGTVDAVESAFAEFIMGAALVASTSFCPTRRGREPLKWNPACPELSREVSL